MRHFFSPPWAKTPLSCALALRNNAGGALHAKEHACAAVKVKAARIEKSRYVTKAPPEPCVHLRASAAACSSSLCAAGARNRCEVRAPAAGPSVVDVTLSQAERATAARAPALRERGSGLRERLRQHRRCRRGRTRRRRLERIQAAAAAARGEQRAERGPSVAFRACASPAAAALPQQRRQPRPQRQPSPSASHWRWRVGLRPPAQRLL
jgi:hypothetical protein